MRNPKRVSEEAAYFLRCNLGHHFPGFTDEALVDFVRFHLAQRTMVIGAHDNEIVGVLIGWGQDEPHHVPFAWQQHKPDAPYFWLDQLAADEPKVVLGMIHTFAGIHPRLLRVPVLGMRNGKPRVYLPGKILKLYKKGSQLYGNQS